MKVKVKMKIKFLIVFVFLFLTLSFSQAAATTVELSIDKENYTVSETIHVNLDLKPNTSVTGSVTIYEIINETASKQYWQLFGTVPCKACARGGVESIDEPFSSTFHRELVDPGNYYMIATFGGVEKKIFFNVSECEDALNITENETAVNGTLNETETNITENETNITENETNITKNETAVNKTACEAGKENLTIIPGTEINESTITDNVSEIKSIGEKTETAGEKTPLYLYILIFAISILIASAIVVIVFLVRRK